MIDLDYMRVYFGASITRYRKLLPVYQSIVFIIEDLGHQVTSKHVIEDKTTQGDWQKDYNPQQLFQREVKRLKESDVFVAELTTPSWGTAFIMEECLKLKKPLLTLHYGLDVDKVPLMLRGNKKLNIQIYTEDNVRVILSKFLSR